MIEAELDRRGWTLQRLATSLSVSKTAVEKWIAGGGVHRDNRDKLAEFLAISRDELDARLRGRRRDVEGRVNDLEAEVARVTDELRAVRALLDEMSIVLLRQQRG